ncbi:MAG: hypothetical protein JSR87_00065 [Proteobacteria bacterium]|nr:hypothetical protein [Pseudomonadota bacterium]MBS0571701.1 hypothetical protein [Pseudomonadota bacterium]
MTDDGEGASGGRIDVERIGGLAGFGGPGARIRSRGTLPLSALSRADRATLDRLLGQAGPAPPMPDEFLYRITRQVGARVLSVEVAESEVPAVLRACVRDELL